MRRLDAYPARRLRHPTGSRTPACATTSRACAKSGAALPWVHVNSGEYLDLRGKRKLIEARGVDILNVHGQSRDVMRAGWLAAEHGIRRLARQHACSSSACIWRPPCRMPTGSNIRSRTTTIWSRSRSRCATATPIAPDRPGHGLALSEPRAARACAAPDMLRSRRPAAGAAIESDAARRPDQTTTRTQSPRQHRRNVMTTESSQPICRRRRGLPLAAAPAAPAPRRRTAPSTTGTISPRRPSSSGLERVMALFKQQYPDIDGDPGEHPQSRIDVEDDGGGRRRQPSPTPAWWWPSAPATSSPWAALDRSHRQDQGVGRATS